MSAIGGSRRSSRLIDYVRDEVEDEELIHEDDFIGSSAESTSNNSSRRSSPTQRRSKRRKIEEVVQSNSKNSSRASSVDRSKYQCLMCSQSNFENSDKLEGHYATSHFRKQLLELVPRSPPFECTKCNGDKFPSREALLKHFGITHGLVGKFLKDLKRNPSRRKQLIRQRSSSSSTPVDSENEVDGGKLTCRVCDAKMSNRSQLRNHAETEHFKDDICQELPNQIPFKCPSKPCSFEGDDLEELYKHYCLKHNVIERFMSKVEDNPNRKQSIPKDNYKENGEERLKTTRVEKYTSSSKSEVKKTTSANDAMSDKELEQVAKFKKEISENLRTKDGRFATAVDGRSMKCICGTVVRTPSPYYWKYFIQKPTIKNGVVTQRGHWFTCQEVKKAGSVIPPPVIPKRVVKTSLISNQPKKTQNEPSVNDGIEQATDSDSEETEKESEHEAPIKRRRSGSVNIKKTNEEISTQQKPPEHSKPEFSIEDKVKELKEKRKVGETFLQDGPCFQMGFDVPMCHVCKSMDDEERKELLMKGDFEEESVDISCCFYSFRKLRLSKGGQTVVAGFLDPHEDPSDKHMALWTTNPASPPSLPLSRVIYMLGLIGDQFCDMIEQEIACKSLHQGCNKSVLWKPAVKGVREMCDICKTTIFNYHWICGRCGIVVCLDCFKFRKTGLVKDVKKTENSDDYDWPLCSNGDSHQVERMMIAQIIPRNALTDLANKLHEMRERWDIPQHCHKKNEFKDLFGDDDNFGMPGSSSPLSKISKERTSNYLPCLICEDGASFKWNSELLKHYLFKHFQDQVKAEFPSEKPTHCPVCDYSSSIQTSLLLHYGITHKKVVKYIDEAMEKNPELKEKKQNSNQRSDAASFPSNSTASQHKIQSKGYRCPLCSMKFTMDYRPEHLTHHYTDELIMRGSLPQSIPFKCPDCVYVALDQRSLVKHYGCKHRHLIPILKEDFCKQEIDAALINEIEEALIASYRGDQENVIVDTNSVVCMLCEKSSIFKTNQEFLRHVNEQHFFDKIRSLWPAIPNENEKKYKCNLENCTYETTSVISFVTHYGISHKLAAKFYQEAIGKPSLEQNIKKEDMVSSQLKQRIELKEMKCVICNENIAEQPMWQHLALSHFKEKVDKLPKTAPFKCSLCPHIALTYIALLKHFGGFHKEFSVNPKDNEDPAREENCERIKEIANGSSENPGITCVLCEDCHSIPGTVLDFQRHLVEHHFKPEILKELNIVEDEKGRKFTCKLCPQEYNLRHQMTKHIGIKHQRVAMLFYKATGIQIQTSPSKRNSFSNHQATPQVPVPFVQQRSPSFDSKSFLGSPQSLSAMGSPQQSSSLDDVQSPRHFPTQVQALPPSRQTSLLGNNSVNPNNSIIQSHVSQQGIHTQLISCPVCSQEVISHENLVIHVAEAHFYGNIENSRKFIEQELMKRLPSSHMNEKPIQSQKQTSSEKVKKPDDKKFPKCEICNYRYFTKVDLLRHFIDNHLKSFHRAIIPLDDTLDCKMCHEKFACRQGLLRHVMGSHCNLETIVMEKYKILLSSFCRTARDIENDKLKANGNINQAKGNVDVSGLPVINSIDVKCSYPICEMCGEEFNNSTNKIREKSNHLLHHFKDIIESEVDAVELKCSRCPYVASDLQDLIRHTGFSHRMLFFKMKEELGENWSVSDIETNRCVICYKVEPTQRALIIHYVKEHFYQQISANVSRDPPFKCPEVSCSFTGKDFDSLITHLGGKHKYVNKFLNGNAIPSKPQRQQNVIIPLIPRDVLADGGFSQHQNSTPAPQEPQLYQVPLRHPNMNSNVPANITLNADQRIGNSPRNLQKKMSLNVVPRPENLQQKIPIDNFEPPQLPVRQNTSHKQLHSLPQQSSQHHVQQAAHLQPAHGQSILEKQLKQRNIQHSEQQHPVAQNNGTFKRNISHHVQNAQAYNVQSTVEQQQAHNSVQPGFQPPNVHIQASYGPDVRQTPQMLSPVQCVVDNHNDNYLAVNGQQVPNLPQQHSPVMNNGQYANAQPQLAHLQTPHLQPSHQQASHLQPSHQQASHLQPPHQQPSHLQPSHQQSSRLLSSQQQSSHHQPFHVKFSNQQPSNLQPAQEAHSHQQPLNQRSSHILMEQQHPQSFFTNGTQNVEQPRNFHQNIQELPQMTNQNCFGNHTQVQGRSNAANLPPPQGLETNQIALGESKEKKAKKSGKGKVSNNNLPEPWLYPPDPGVTEPYSIECKISDCNHVAKCKTDFIRHLCEKHFKVQLSMDLPKEPPFNCPVPDCSYVSRDKANTFYPLVKHYGIVHQGVMKHIKGKILGKFVPLKETQPTKKRDRSADDISVDAQSEGLSTNSSSSNVEAFRIQEINSSVAQDNNVAMAPINHYQHPQAYAQQPLQNVHKQNHFGTNMAPSYQKPQTLPDVPHMQQIQHFNENQHSQQPNYFGSQHEQVPYMNQQQIHIGIENDFKFDQQIDGTYDPSLHSDQSMDGIKSNSVTPVKDQRLLISPVGGTQNSGKGEVVKTETQRKSPRAIVLPPPSMSACLSKESLNKIISTAMSQHQLTETNKVPELSSKDEQNLELIDQVIRERQNKEPDTNSSVREPVQCFLCDEPSQNFPSSAELEDHMTRFHLNIDEQVKVFKNEKLSLIYGNESSFMNEKNSKGGKMSQVDGAEDLPDEDTDKSKKESEQNEDEDYLVPLDPCPICKEENKVHKMQHFAYKHFKEKLQRDLPAQPPFDCKLCDHTTHSKINLWLHHLGPHRFARRWVIEDLGDKAKDFLVSRPKRDLESEKSLEDSKPPVSKRRTYGGPIISFNCDLCQRIVHSESSKLDHMCSVHFKERLEKELPHEEPFCCPLCKFGNKGYEKLQHHFLTKHGYEQEWMRQEQEELSFKFVKEEKLLKAQKEKQKAANMNTIKKLIRKEEKDEEEIEDFKDFVPLEDPDSTFQEYLKTLNVPENILKGSFSSGSKESAVFTHDKQKRLTSPPELVSSNRISRTPVAKWSMTTELSAHLYSDVPHEWLCDGRLLVLTDPSHPGNTTLFQHHWIRGQPVIVSNVSERLDIKNLWSPESFSKEYGDVRHNIVNTKSGLTIPNVPLKKFWDGFDNLSSRMLDEHNKPMLLKLKDWPPDNDFASYLPERFDDLMKCVPLKDYTLRQGHLNLARSIPDFFVRPDLGPKMYIAYGNALYPETGTTNLHIDMSDACNVIVYVGMPKDGDYQEHYKMGLQNVDESDCDLLTRVRSRRPNARIGAIWHIYHPRDADKIRAMLNQVLLEKGQRLEPNTDPIHDQRIYLDENLRKRLYKEYGVIGYAFPQCEGDTVFIPAGAPHQVRNVHNCIKVAEDFVSPENLEWCFYQTEEFRHLSDTHTNHEDKLQIKNILFHAVKDCISVLEALENEHKNDKVQEITEIKEEPQVVC